MSHKAHLILIGGGTCSGKTTIAKAIGRRIGSLKTVILSHDNYYRDLSHLSLEARAKVNFDHPDSIDQDYLVHDLKLMLAGEAVNVPDYDFATHSRTEGKLCIAGAEVIILEGIFALYYNELLNLSDLKIFLDSDSDIRLARRLQRDILQRGRDAESVLNQYLETVKPSRRLSSNQPKRTPTSSSPAKRNSTACFTCSTAISST